MKEENQGISLSPPLMSLFQPARFMAVLTFSGWSVVENGCGPTCTKKYDYMLLYYSMSIPTTNTPTSTLILFFYLLEPVLLLILSFYFVPNNDFLTFYRSRTHQLSLFAFYSFWFFQSGICVRFKSSLVSSFYSFPNLSLYLRIFI